MAGNKTIATDSSVAQFLASIDHRVRQSDAHALSAMMGRITGEAPRMWGSSIVGFGQYHYRYDSGREGDFMITGFAPRKANLVLYIMGGFEGFDDLRARLGKHKVGKSCLYINKLADVDLTVLEELITRSVAAMRAKYPA